ncbi:MAG: 30S ribosome-binding factor RbfA [Deltaproteobacteria bacterium]|nr:30S ribosome-binding factor RbfA [Deltaproteobacteria bacterium]
MNFNRTGRVGDLLRAEVASMILHQEIKDPRIGFVTITNVLMSKDLKHARIFFSMLGSEKEVKDSMEGLNSASGFVRRALAKRLRLKNIPSVRFEFDETLEYSSHIEEVLKEVKE